MNLFLRPFSYVVLALIVFAVLYTTFLLTPNLAAFTKIGEGEPMVSYTPNRRFAPISQEPISFSLNPITPTVTTGDIFTVTVQISTGSQPVDSVAVYLDFNAALLQVEEVISGTEFPSLLLNQFSNQDGTIDFAAGKLTAPFPSGSVTVMRIRFLTVQAGTTSIEYHQQGIRVTEAVYEGTSLPITVTGADVTIQNSVPGIASVTVSANPTTLVANGTSQSAIVATVRDINNAPVNGVIVNFAATLGTLSSSTSTTNASGQASVILTSGTAAGTSAVTAIAGGINGQVNVGFLIQPTSTSTSTSTATPRPMNTPTPTATATPNSGTQARLNCRLEESSVPLNAQTRLVIEVTNAVNLFGYELRLSYESTKLQMINVMSRETRVNFSLGDFIYPDFVVANWADNSTGQAQIALTQIGRQPVSGAGELASIAVIGIQPGSTSLTLHDVILSDHMGITQPVTLQGCTVNIIGSSSTPTPTPPVSKPTPMPTLVLPAGESIYLPHIRR